MTNGVDLPGALRWYASVCGMPSDYLTESADEIERLRDQNTELCEALDALCKQDAAYYGPEIRIDCGNHGDAIATMRKARTALAKARGETGPTLSGFPSSSERFGGK